MKKNIIVIPKIQDLIASGGAPHWMTQESIQTLYNGYLLPGETPHDMYKRVADSAANHLKKPELSTKFFDYMWKNWLCPASPVCSNAGTDRGLVISCFGLSIGDSIDGIMGSMHEVAMLSKNGGGIGTYWGNVRSRGSVISGNGTSDGIVPFLKILDSTTIGINQGGVRRGASSAYLPASHGDIEEFLRIRRPEGDANRQCLNINHAVCIDDQFIAEVKKGKTKSREIWKEIIKTRFETGEPYLFFSDNVERHRPDCYKHYGLNVEASQLCNEIYLHSDEEHTFVCCLSSVNAARWEEWKDTDLVQTSIWFLDGIMEEFIEKAEKIKGFERAVRFSKKSRALGLGVLGWHSLLQQKELPFDSFDTYMLNGQIFKHMRSEADKATSDLAKEYGEPEWCKGFGRRNTHCLSIAPTVSNSLISGNVSAGIEPFAANAYTQKSAKGTFPQKNRHLEQVLEKLGQNTEDVWKSIITNDGSVQHLDFLSVEQKEVYLTAREINQFAIVKLAGQRQKWIDQGQSLNLFFPKNVSAKYLNEVHLLAHEEGLMGLYYCRSSSAIKGDTGSSEYKREISECKACEG